MGPTRFLSFILLVSITLQCATAANILFFWGVSSYSHRITVWPLVKALADNGHKVTFLSPFEPKSPTTHPNISELVPKDLFGNLGMNYDPAEIRVRDGPKAVQGLWPSYQQLGINLCNALTKDQAIIDWANKASFDLVVVNGLFNDCGYGFAYKFKAQTIAYATSSLFQWWGEVFGVPEENYPEFYYHMPLNMTFTQQVLNTFTPLYWYGYRMWTYLPKIEGIVRPGLGIPDMPSILEVEQQSSLVLLNTHFSEEFPRSLPPWFVPVGGMHCTDQIKPLPDNIQKFIDSWDSGFIYFSFGTYLRLPNLPQKFQDAIFEAIAKFPSIGFVMKWNGGEVPKNMPKNVLPLEWLPQQDIVANPKIRGFISHGGLLSTQEAVYNAVPIIVFPFFAEQDYNAQRIHGAERGIMMEISELTAGNLEHSIREILTNKKYKENMVQVSRRFKDRPAKPVETALWWVEYALRHKNTSFLRPIGVTRTWYERRMLHIWVVVAFGAIAGFLIILLMLRAIMRITSKGKSGRDKKKVKTN